MIPHARQVSDPSTSDEHYGVLLEVVADSGYVGRDFHTIGKPDSGYFSKRRVRLLRRFGSHYKANASLLRITPQGRSRGSFLDPLAALSYKLIDRRQAYTPNFEI